MSAEICLSTEGEQTDTSVPNFFIDRYMAGANGEYVKVYLCLLRLLGMPNESVSVTGLAERLEDTEGDIFRALSYWDKAGVLHLSFDEEKNLTGIRIVRMPDRDGRQENAKEGKQSESALPDNVKKLPTKPTYTKKELAAFSGQEEIEQLLYLCERYLGRQMTSEDVSYVLYWNRELRFSADLVECLIEYMVSAKGKERISSLRYLQNVAENWYDQGIHTPEEAKNYMKRSDTSAMQNVVMSSLGIKGRSLVASEISMVQKWTDAWGFDKELIAEACRRTIANTHEPSLNYTESILANWRKQGISSLEEVKKADEDFQNRKAAELTAKKNVTSGSRQGNHQEKTSAKIRQYYTCPNRDYDYDELAKQLLKQS